MLWCYDIHTHPKLQRYVGTWEACDSKGYAQAYLFRDAATDTCLGFSCPKYTSEELETAPALEDERILNKTIYGMPMDDAKAYFETWVALTGWGGNIWR